MSKRALIVGSGLGGLATAVRLVKSGYQVQMVEKFNRAGGRLNQIKKDGFTFDMGPSFFSMTYEFQEFVKDTGIEMPFEFVPLDPLYTVNIAGHNRSFRIYKELSRLAEEFEGIEPDFERKMKRFLASAGSFFHDSIDRVVKRNYSSIAQFLFTLTRVPMKHVPKLIRSVWQEMERYFSSEEVKQIFSLVAFFLGATPFDTPGVYTLLSYTELVHDGYHNVRGSMYQIVEGLLKTLENEDFEIAYNTEIVDYQQENGKLKAFVDQHGKQWRAEVFVVNSDAAGFRHTVFNRKRYTEQHLDNKKWTLAPFTMYLGIKGKIDTLEHHNYFLGNNFREYAAKIFKNSISLEKPYYYVNVLSKFNENSAPGGHESVFILCPLPDMRYKPDWSDTSTIADNIIADLSQRIGYDIQGNLVSKTLLNPKDWANMFNLYKGSGLGLAHDLNQIGAFRPPNADEKLRNVFYVGASTVPGTGLPMAVISSKLVTERIHKRHGAIS